MTTIYYVTGNAGKFEEAKSFIENHAPDIHIEQCDQDIEEIQSLDQKAVTIDKVKKAFKLVNKPVLVDDGGLFFDAYHQFPGTLSKFVFQGLGFAGIFKLLADNNKASFIIHVAYYDGQHIEVFIGQTHGEIIQPKDYSSHPQLPFTAIFKPNGSDKTLAELRNTPEFSNYSFRQQALRKFCEWYRNK